MKSIKTWLLIGGVLQTLLFCIGCKISEKNVIGNWTAQLDTIRVLPNKSFILIKNDSVIKGDWYISKKCLHLNFANNKVFGNCNSICIWNKFLSNKKLVRPSSCNQPTHRFIVYEKVSK